MKTVTANAWFWLLGLGVALAGVAVARWLGPTLVGSARIGVTVTGQLLALAGLFIICLGVRRRINRSTSLAAEPRPPP